VLRTLGLRPRPSLQGFSPDIYSFNALVSVYARGGRWPKALGVAGAMQAMRAPLELVHGGSADGALPASDPEGQERVRAAPANVLDALATANVAVQPDRTTFNLLTKVAP
jgi:pentatricopeptide repeat protein